MTSGSVSRLRFALRWLRPLCLPVSLSLNKFLREKNVFPIKSPGGKRTESAARNDSETSKKWENTAGMSETHIKRCLFEREPPKKCHFFVNLLLQSEVGLRFTKIATFSCSRMSFYKKKSMKISCYSKLTSATVS